MTSGPVAPPGPPAPSRRRMLAGVVLSFEALVVLFAGLAARGLSVDGGRSGGGGAVLVAAGVLALACLLGAALLRSPVGYPVGWLLQLLVLGTGFRVPVMFGLGAVFAAIWVASMRVGGRIDRERAQAGAQAGAQDGTQDRTQGAGGSDSAG